MLTRNLWQKKLGYLSIRLKNRKAFKKNSYNIDAEIEFNIMSGFFIIRKLIEHKKLTNKFISTNIKGNKYQFLPTKKITPFNDHKWSDFYDFNNKIKAKFDITFLCNQFVHSYYFIPSDVFLDESLAYETDDEFYSLCKNHKRKYKSILFNSDDKKHEYLYEIDIDKIVNIFEEVSLIDITEKSITYNYRMDRFDYVQSNENSNITPHVSVSTSDELK